MPTLSMSWTAMPLPQLIPSEDPMENTKQVLKALKCVAFSTMQVSAIVKRKRERLLKRVQAVNDETELLRADIFENVMNQRDRRQLIAEIVEDIERAQTLGNPDILRDLADELKDLKHEDGREKVLLHNLKRSVRSRVRVRNSLLQEKLAVEKSMAIFNCKNNLIQNMVATCAKTSFISSEPDYDAEEEEYEDEESSQAGATDYDLSDLAYDEDDINMDVEMAAEENDDYPKLRVLQPADEIAEEEIQEDGGEQSSVSAWSFDTDSQASSSMKDDRSRSVSFSPLTLEDLEEEDVDMGQPMGIEELQDEADPVVDEATEERNEEAVEEDDSSVDQAE